jgi:hypothetical protein
MLDLHYQGTKGARTFFVEEACRQAETQRLLRDAGLYPAKQGSLWRWALASVERWITRFGEARMGWYAEEANSETGLNSL